MANKADAVTKAIDSFIAKVKYIKFKAKVDDADIEKLTDDRKKLIGDESKLLEDHRKENKDILTRHFYDMSNMIPQFGSKHVRDASIYTSKKISLKFLFLSDIFFPFIRQQFPVLSGVLGGSTAALFNSHFAILRYGDRLTGRLLGNRSYN